MAAATVEFRVVYGAAPGSEEASDAVDLNLLGADIGSNEDPATFPIRIPETGEYSYSYERVFRLRAVALNDTLYCNNFRVWANSATPATGCSIYYRVKTAYSQPVNTSAGIAESGTPALIPTADPGYAAPNITIGGATDGRLDADGEYTDYVYLQLKVDDTATTGATATISVAWDEVV